MAVKLAVAMGAEVTVISRSNAKDAEAKQLGATGILVSTDDNVMAQSANQFDLIIDTAPVQHDVTPYMPLLDVDGTLVIVGQVGPLDAPMTYPLIFGRRRIAGSLIGGIAETQEVLDFCAKHNIHPECEMIRMDEINKAFTHLAKGDISHRYVIDMASLDATHN
jgi:uncharacterized zinc-type alcohol dehydrogenase-like protein